MRFDMRNYRIKKFSIRYIFKISKIYKQSFSKEEKFSFFLLLINLFRNDSNMYILIDNKMVVAFIYIINYKKMSFVLYLATNKRKRNKGYGSYLLNWFTENNQKRDIFVNIEEVNDKYEDNILRKKKLAFYLKNKFFSTGYLSVEKDENFDIL